jgi:hypothetical protein
MRRLASNIGQSVGRLGCQEVTLACNLEAETIWGNEGEGLIDFGFETAGSEQGG